MAESPSSNFSGSNFSDLSSYSQDEVQQILHLAIARQTEQEDVTRSQLLEIAAELGISPSEIEVAEQDWRLNQGELLHRQAFDRDRHQAFQQQALKFLMINGFLVLFNLLTSSGLTWSLYVLVFWGFGLAMKARKTYWLGTEEYRRRFEVWQRNRKIKRSLSTLVNRVLPS